VKVAIVALLLGAIALGGGASAYVFFVRPSKPATPAAKVARGARDNAKDKDGAKDRDNAKDRSAARDGAATNEKTAVASAKDKDAAATSATKTPAAGTEALPANTTGGAAGTARDPNAAAAAVPGAGNPAAGAAAPAADPKVSEEIRRLARLYEGMRPKEAATVLARLDPELLTTILVTMRERQASKILGLLPAQKAADISTRIARSKPRKNPPVDARAARGGPTS
jgi:flagellar motility protein MotE (MotC chaperone)